MLTLSGDQLYLRALEPEDLEFLYEIENDETIWHVSNTQTPYSRFLIKQYLENARMDIYEAKQLRLSICRKGSRKAIGLIDLFEFDPRNDRAGVGIVLQAGEDRGKGYGSEALDLLIRYGFKHLNLHQLYANIDPANDQSVKLFTKFGFVKTGLKKDWTRTENGFSDEAVYQLINNK